MAFNSKPKKVVFLTNSKGNFSGAVDMDLYQRQRNMFNRGGQLNKFLIGIEASPKSKYKKTNKPCCGKTK